MGGVGDSALLARVDQRTLPRSDEWRRKIRATMARRAGIAIFTDADVVTAYRKPLSLRRTAERFGITHERVRQILKANGEPVRAPYLNLSRRRP